MKRKIEDKLEMAFKADSMCRDILSEIDGETPRIEMTRDMDSYYWVKMPHIKYIPGKYFNPFKIYIPIEDIYNKAKEDSDLYELDSDVAFATNLAACILIYIARSRMYGVYNLYDEDTNTIFSATDCIDYAMNTLLTKPMAKMLKKNYQVDFKTFINPYDPKIYENDKRYKDIRRTRKKADKIRAKLSPEEQPQFDDDGLRAIIEFFMNRTKWPDEDKEILTNIMNKDSRNFDIRVVVSYPDDYGKYQFSRQQFLIGYKQACIEEYTLTKYCDGEYRINASSIERLRNYMTIIAEHLTSPYISKIYDKNGEIVSVILYFASI